MSTYKLASSVSSLGILLIFTAIIVAQSTFVGHNCESYDFGVHFISELGNHEKNKFYFLLNYGFMIVSLSFIPLTFLLGRYTESKLGRIASITGVIAMLAIFAVGCIPENQRYAHLIAAVSFFSISAIMSGMFAFLSWNKNNKLNKFLFFPSLLPVLLFILFLFYPKTELNNITADPTYVRPNIVWLAVLEWSYFLTMSLWVLCASYFLWKAADDKEKPLELNIQH